MIFSRPDSDEISRFYRQIAVMRRSDVPLADAISALSEERGLPAVKRIAARVKKDLALSTPLKESLGKHPDIFNPVLIRILTSDIDHQTEAKLLEKFAETEERTGQGNKKAYSIMLYPLFVLCFAMIVTFALVVFVIPVFQEMFADFGFSLPTLTRVVFSISHFIKSNLIYFVCALSLIIVFFIFNRKYIYLISSKLPHMGALHKKIAISNFAGYLSLMLSIGTPLKNSLDHAARSIKNPFYADRLKDMAAKSNDVSGLNQWMKGSGLFPIMLLKIIEINQTPKALESAMAETSRYLGKSIDGPIEKQMTVLEISILLFLGIVVGVLVVAMYLPIFKMAYVL